MSNFGKVEQVDAIDNAVLVNIMVEERQKTLKEKSKIFSNHVQDIVVLGGVNIILSLLFYISYYVDSIHQEDDSKDDQCTHLVRCSYYQAIFHTICAILYILLPIFCYISANKEDPKYFSLFRNSNLVLQTIFFLVFIALTGNILNTLAQQEPCGSLKIIFISYVILAICLIITVLGIIIFNWIVCDSPKANIQSKEREPINQIKDQIKYVTNE